ncbi:DUF4913 domain-containing protein [Streptomyces sp. NPDC004250]|uniref:DUF4913 domain-containing protein n=1 Tax=Streptomyces sp. NPDC004250 TaxID=3364692 RepID=UPI0036CCC927
MSPAPTERPDNPDAEEQSAPSPKAGADGTGPVSDGEEVSAPQFILYLEGPEYALALRRLTLWVHHVLLPVYGNEVTSSSPWCSEWWEHPEAVAKLHGLWLAWGDLTGPGSDLTGPAVWHRDHLSPTMSSIRDPQGPFAGCKPGTHRQRESFPLGVLDPFAPLAPMPSQ